AGIGLCGHGRRDEHSTSMIPADISSATRRVFEGACRTYGTGKKEGFIPQKTCDGETYLAPLGMTEEEGGMTGRR
ncbi:MAG: hypothetical protein WCD68_14635, partial [Candidatus Acidiferrum sp.]